MIECEGMYAPKLRTLKSAPSHLNFARYTAFRIIYICCFLQ